MTSALRIVGSFLFRWFFVLMLLGCAMMAVLAASGVVRERTWRDSPLAYALMCAFWAAAILAEWTSRRSLRRTPAEAAAMWVRRTAEAKRWLRRRVSFDEALALLQEDGDLTRSFEDWYRSAETDGAELWLYDTGEEAWKQLAGEWGFALVREDRVLDILMLAMN